MNSKQKSALSKIFAISGTVLLWAPILVMFVTAIVGSIISKALLFDYYTLVELFPLVALGLILLVLASLLTRTFRKWFGWGSVAALVALTSGQILISASGAMANSGVIRAVFIAAIVVYSLVVVALAILGFLLVRRLFQKQPEITSAVE